MAISERMWQAGVTARAYEILRERAGMRSTRRPLLNRRQEAQAVVMADRIYAAARQLEMSR